jgi:hypothetical protein
MPHDRFGNELKVGDLVLIEAEVTSISPSVDYCNCTVKTTTPMPPYPDGTSITLNTKQVAKRAEPDGPAQEL